MTELDEKKFLDLIEVNEGIIHKVVGIYTTENEDKKDLTQEILFQAWSSVRNFRADAKFSTWLYRVALNTALNYKKKVARKVVSQRLSEKEFKIPKPKAKDTDTELLYVVIRQLDEVDRMLITLHLDGYKNMEIAEISGMSVNHINVKLHRIKKQITERFKAIYNET